MRLHAMDVMGPLRSEDDRTAALAVPAQAAQRQPQVFVQRDQSATPFLGCAIVQFDRGRIPPRGSSTISQVMLAISFALRPALIDSKTRTRLRSGRGGHQVHCVPAGLNVTWR